MGRDRVQHLWRREGLKIPPKHGPRRRLRLNDGSCVRMRLLYRNHIWSFDFVQGQTPDAMCLHGIPEHIRCGNGPEMVSKAPCKWVAKTGPQIQYLVATPCSARASRNSASMMLPRSSHSLRIRGAWASMTCERWSPPIGLGATWPSWCERCDQRLALDTLTSKRAAARWHEAPAATAARRLGRGTGWGCITAAPEGMRRG
mgnify:CR=1 FL=1